MCGRYTLRANLSKVGNLFPDMAWPETVPRFNIAPTQNVIAARHNQDAAKLEAVWLRWGLVPSWAQDSKVGFKLINARSEEMASKPSFRSAFKRRRCLIPADGFYEWQTIGKAKQPIHFRLKDEAPFAFAGLWEHWQKDADVIESCTIITTEANDIVRPYHNRMPVILPTADFSTWLDPKPTDPAVLLELMRPFPAAEMLAVPVSAKVNNARNEGTDLWQE